MAREHTITADPAHPGASFQVAVAATAADQRDVTFVENHAPGGGRADPGARLPRPGAML